MGRTVGLHQRHTRFWFGSSVSGCVCSVLFLWWFCGSDGWSLPSKPSHHGSVMSQHADGEMSQLGQMRCLSDTSTEERVSSKHLLVRFRFTLVLTELCENHRTAADEHGA